MCVFVATYFASKVATSLRNVEVMDVVVFKNRTEFHATAKFPPRGHVIHPYEPKASCTKASFQNDLSPRSLVSIFKRPMI